MASMAEEHWFWDMDTVQLQKFFTEANFFHAHFQ